MATKPMSYLKIRNRYTKLWRERYSDSLLWKSRPEMMRANNRVRAIEKHLKRIDAMMTDQEFLTVYRYGKAA